MRTSVLLTASLVVLGCSRTSTGPSAEADAGGAARGDAAMLEDAAGAADAGPSARAGAAIFSAPVAAARDPRGARTYVAGLRAAERVITLMLVDELGVESFRADVFTGVGWSSDADLRVYASASGAWVVWRGLTDGGRSERAAFVSDEGKVSALVTDVGPAHCAIGDVLHVVRGGEVLSRAPDGGASRTRLADPSAEVSVLCDRQLLLLTESEQGAFVELPGDGGARRFSAFNSDSEGRTTALFSSGERAGVVRVGGAEATVRELTDGGLSRPRAERIALSEDDDIVLLDALGRGPVLVTTHESDLACDAGASMAPGISVTLLGTLASRPTQDAGGVGAGGSRSDAGASAPSSAELAPPACGRERGPFWSGAAGGDLVVAWGERVRQSSKTVAPIAAIGFARVLADGSVGERGTIEVAADALVDAACDARDCYVAALLRPTGEDDGKPEAVRVFPLRSGPRR